MRKTTSPAEMGFVKQDLKRLATAMKNTNKAREYRRLQAVWLAAQGHTVADVARLTQAPERSVYRWIENYLETHSVSALEHRRGAGRPEAAKSITRARILRELRRDPLKLGYNTNVWTVALLARHLSQVCQCPITGRTLRRRMKEIGLVWKRPRYVYVTKEPHRAQKKGRLSEN
jgi:transposase